MPTDTKNRAAVLGAACAAALGGASLLDLDSAHAAARVGVLRVDALGFASAKGHAEAKLFRTGDNVLREPFRRLRVVPSAGKASFVFSDLAYGSYAVVVFHDGNDNHKIDHDFLGLPVEALGFSNGFSPGLFTGMPTFEKLKFNFSGPAQVLPIRVK